MSTRRCGRVRSIHKYLVSIRETRHVPHVRGQNAHGSQGSRSGQVNKVFGCTLLLNMVGEGLIFGRVFGKTDGGRCRAGCSGRWTFRLALAV